MSIRKSLLNRVAGAAERVPRISMLPASSTRRSASGRVYGGTVKCGIRGRSTACRRAPGQGQRGIVEAMQLLRAWAQRTHLSPSATLDPVAMPRRETLRASSRSADADRTAAPARRRGFIGAVRKARKRLDERVCAPELVGVSSR